MLAGYCLGVDAEPDLSADRSSVRAARVPVDHRRLVERIARAPENQFKALVEAVATSGNEGPRLDLSEAVGQAMGLAEDDASDMVAALVGVLSVARNRSISYDLAAVAISKDPALGLQDDEREVLARRYAAIAALPPLRLISSARRVYAASERHFCTASFRGAIVPLFEDPAVDETTEGKVGQVESKAAKAAIVATDLAIYYHEGEDRKAFHVTLDLRGLLALTHALSSAAREMAGMSQVLADAGIQQVDTGGHH